MVRNVLPTSNVQGKKNELDCKNNELLLDYNLENKNNLYLNHMPPAAEALGKNGDSGSRTMAGPVRAMSDTKIVCFCM